MTILRILLGIFLMAADRQKHRIQPRPKRTLH